MLTTVISYATYVHSPNLVALATIPHQGSFVYNEPHDSLGSLRIVIFFPKEGAVCISQGTGSVNVTGTVMSRCNLLSTEQMTSYPMFYLHANVFSYSKLSKSSKLSLIENTLSVHYNFKFICFISYLTLGAETGLRGQMLISATGPV